MKPSQLAKLKKSDPEKYAHYLASRPEVETNAGDVEKAVIFTTPAIKARAGGVTSVMADQLAQIVEPKQEEGSQTLLDQSDESYSLALSALEQDKKQLKGKSLPDKLEYKREAVPRYLEFLTGYVESKRRYYNEVLVTIGLWLIDVSDIERAFYFLDYAIGQQQPAPKGFTRTLEEILTEQVSDWATEQNKASHSASPYLEKVAEQVHSKQYQINNLVIESKIFRQAAINATLAEDLEGALMWYERCMESNPEKHGVKTKHAQIKSRLEKQQRKPAQEQC